MITRHLQYCVQSFAGAVWPALCYALLLACSPKDAGPQKTDKPVPITAGDSGVYVLNQGNYGFTPGSIDFIQLPAGKVSHDVYKAVNGQSPGNVLQSAVKWKDHIYLIVNESQEVQQLEAATLRRIKTLSGLNSPRHFLPVNDQKAYVSDLYAGELHVIHPVEMHKTGSIPIGSWTEQMLFHNGKVYVIKKRRDLESSAISTGIWVIDPITDALTDSLPLPLIPVGMALDDKGYLHIAGRNDQNTEAKVYKINPENLNVMHTLDVPASGILADEYALKSMDGGKRMCLLARDVYVWNSHDEVFPTAPLIPANGRILYGLGVSPVQHEIWISDALDYLQKGVIYRYNTAGKLLAEYRAGIVPGYFLFENW